MFCERLKKGPLFFLLLAACSRETPTPLTQTTATASTTSATPAPSAPAVAAKTYDDALTWFRTTPGFHFVVEEGGVRAEGDMTREHVGAERIAVTVNGETYSAASGPRGVTWHRRGAEVAAPEWGNRLFQRVTVAFDPQKQEGQAQPVAPGHYRFTDANSGNVHEVWTNDAGQITKMTVGQSMSMTLSNQR